VQCDQCGHKGRLPRRRSATASPLVGQKVAKPSPTLTAPAAPSARQRRWSAGLLVLVILGGISFGIYQYLPRDSKQSTALSVETQPVIDLPPFENIPPVAESVTPEPLIVASDTPQQIQRPFITTDTVLRLIADDLENSVPQFDRRSTRYFTLTHLHNASVSDERLEACRVGFFKLLNSLSWHAEVYQPVAIDAEQTIYRVDMQQLKWRTKTWQDILDQDPYAFAFSNTDAARCAEMTGESVAIVRADWFVFAASRPPLYYSLLGVCPDTCHQTSLNCVEKKFFSACGLL
jgi:hypothetical protein